MSSRLRTLTGCMLPPAYALPAPRPSFRQYAKRAQWALKPARALQPGSVAARELNQAPGLPERLGDLALGIAIGDDATPRVVGPTAVSKAHRPNRHAELESTIVTHEAGRAGVEPTPGRFELGDELHRTD